MNSIALWLAWRSLLASSYQKSISPMVIVCFSSIFIGAFSLALVTAIMNGFEIATHEKMQGIHAQVIIRGYGESLNIGALKEVLKNEFPQIKAFSPSTTRYALVQTAETEGAPSVIMLKAIDPKHEQQISILPKKIITQLPQTHFEKLIIDNQVVIGKRLAENLEVSVGDTIELLFTPEEQPRGRKITLDTKDAIVSGIFDTGIEEFDSNLVVSSFDFLDQLFPDAGVEQINIKLKAGSNETAIVQTLRDRLNLEVYSWKELYPALVSALALEKYVAFFILALITLVASMNIISLLFMQITQKRPDIAILKTMGMSNNSITNIFLFFGLIISTVASLAGLCCAWIASWFLEQYPFIELPDVYYVTHLPVKMEWNILIAVFIVVMLLGFVATWFPARKTRSINIAETLRYEG